MKVTEVISKKDITYDEYKLIKYLDINIENRKTLHIYGTKELKQFFIEELNCTEDSAKWNINKFLENYKEYFQDFDILPSALFLSSNLSRQDASEFLHNRVSGVSIHRNKCNLEKQF